MAALPWSHLPSWLQGCQPWGCDPHLLLLPLCSSINVTLGAHNIKQHERTQQVIRVRRAIPHPDYNPKDLSNDIMLLKVNHPASHALLGSARFPSQDHLPLSSLPFRPPDQSLWLRREGRQVSVIAVSRLGDHRLSQTLVSSHQLERKAKQTSAVKPLSLPRAMARVKPGQVCSVAGWGRDSMTTYPDTLQEVKLIVQQDAKCESHLPNYYNHTTQLCVGDPKTRKASFQVRITAYPAWIWGEGCWQKIWDLGTQAVGDHLTL